ncbi:MULTISPECIES: hypothetical protein [Aquimarina]|uniref:Uncharacterized protein n=1 Tax=Aquimarina rubra TaxID=1920033 RepID=A0ABW5LEG0_9FLAO
MKKIEKFEDLRLDALNLVKGAGDTLTNSKETRESTFDSDSACGGSCEQDANGGGGLSDQISAVGFE